jgi:DNA-binding response OmpR family regulator
VRSSAQSAAPTRAPHGRCVVAIDDDETLLAIVRLSLAKDGVAVETAASAAAGLALLATAPADLVVLDIVLPDLSGWEVLHRIRLSSDVPVMILSARATGVDKARGLDLGADDYLTKPFDLLEFEARVRALLRRAHRVAPRAAAPKV